MANSLKVLSSLIFFLAIIHTFLVSKFAIVAKKFPSHSFAYKILYIFSEIELVFIFWSFVFSVLLLIFYPYSYFVHSFSELSFHEPFFVFGIVVVSASRPILNLAKWLIEFIAQSLPFSPIQNQFFTILFFGPLLGSLITEPAAMTVVSLLISDHFKKKKFSKQFRYAVLAILLLSISIGGTLTHFAAPPIIMVSIPWELTTSKMFWRFGYKAILTNFVLVTSFLIFFKHEMNYKTHNKTENHFRIGFIETSIFILLGLCILFAHRIEVMFLIMLFFYALSFFYKERIGQLNSKNALFISLFLIGLMFLGQTQKWWLITVLTKFHDWQLYLATASLTAVIDNAALTYLGSLTPISSSGQFAMLAGAVVGGGLTVMANAPNPIAFNILKSYFEEQEIDGVLLFKWSILPTTIAILVFWLLPNFA